MRFSFANSCFGIYIDLTWGLFRQVGKWVLRVMQNFIMLIFKVSAFQRRFPWELLVVPKRTEFCGTLVDFTLQMGTAWTLLQWDVTSLLFRWFKFTLKPPNSITHGNLLSAIWDTSHWNFFVKFGLKTA